MGKKGLLPSGYMQVKYVESNGSQYIWTGITYNSANTYQIDCDVTFLTSAQMYNGWDAGGAFGTKDGLIDNGSNKGSIDILNKELHLSFIINSGLSSTSVITYSVDGNQETMSRWHASLAKYASDSSYVLFACFSQNAVRYYTSERMGICEIKVNNKLVRKYIPCISPSNVAGMFDVVEGRFYASDTNVPFIAVL